LSKSDALRIIRENGPAPVLRCGDEECSLLLLPRGHQRHLAAGGRGRPGRPHHQTAALIAELAIKTHPKKTTKKNQKTHLKNPTKNVFCFVKFFYENNTNFSL
jgi:hypothetical protein